MGVSDCSFRTRNYALECSIFCTSHHKSCIFRKSNNLLPQYCPDLRCLVSGPLRHLFQCPACSVQLPADRRMHLFWVSQAQRKGAHPSIPALIRLLMGPILGPFCTPRPLAWACAETRRGSWGWGACRAGCPTHGTPAEGDYWRSNRLALRVPDGYSRPPPLFSVGSPFSCFQPTKDNLCVSIFLIQIATV